jgi:hypothetical protein
MAMQRTTMKIPLADIPVVPVSDRAPAITVAAV